MRHSPKTRKGLKRQLAIGLASTFLLWTAGQVQADSPFSQSIAFGASYEDVGQLPDIDIVSLALPILVAPPGAGLDGSTGQRQTNIDATTGKRGRVWVEHLSMNLGAGEIAPSTPILFPGDRVDIPATNNISFAVVTARSDEVLQSVIGSSEVTHPAGALLGQDLSASSPGLTQRLADGSLSISKRTLFIANPGGNNVRDTSLDTPEADGATAAINSLAVIQAIADAGGRYILTTTMPPLGELSESTNVTPDGDRTEKAIARSIAGASFNTTFTAGLSDIDANVILLDFGRLFEEILGDPGSFGFNAQVEQNRYCYSDSEWSISGVNCTEAPGLGKSSGGDPADFIANDGLHPTQATAKILSDYAESVIRAPGLMTLLPESVLGDARAFGNTITDYQSRNRWSSSPPDGLDVFASVQGEDADYEKSNFNSPAASDALDLTLGVSWFIDRNWFVGGAVGSQNSELDADPRGSGFDTSSLMFSVFGGYRGTYLFTDASVTLGRSDLEDITRVISLGETLKRAEEGKTDADITGVSITIGVDTTADELSWHFGPFLSLDYLKIEVDGFAEESDLSTAMVFGDLERDSLLGSAGIFINYPMRWGNTALVAYGDLAYRSEMEGESARVSAALKNLASSVHFSMPGYDIDKESVSVRGGLQANFGGLRCNLFASYDNNDRETTYLGLGLAYQL